MSCDPSQENYHTSISVIKKLSRETPCERLRGTLLAGWLRRKLLSSLFGPMVHGKERKKRRKRKRRDREERGGKEKKKNHICEAELEYIIESFTATSSRSSQLICGVSVAHNGSHSAQQHVAFGKR